MIILSEMNITEYDQRQLSLMREKLKLYMQGEISLKNLIDDLDGLLSCLMSVGAEWKGEFHEHWFVLEQVYAVALFRNEPIEFDDPDIQDALKQLRHLLTT